MSLYTDLICVVKPHIPGVLVLWHPRFFYAQELGGDLVHPGLQSARRQPLQKLFAVLAPPKNLKRTSAINAK